MHNILTLTGDPPSIGDHPDARPVFETDSTGLIEIARTLNSGYDMAGNSPGSPPVSISAPPAILPLPIWMPSCAVWS